HTQKVELQAAAPEDDPNVITSPAETNITADQILDKYLQTLGGATQLAGIASFTATGTYSGFDTDHKEVPVDIYAKAPNQRTWIIHMPAGDSYRLFDAPNPCSAPPHA